MRYIEKQQASVGCLHSEQQTPPTDSSVATARWDQFRAKDDLTEMLDTEQCGLCAYTELRPDEAGLGTHIEHIKPKSTYPDLTFDYQNLVLCALASEDLGNPDIRNNQFGGHAKGNEYDGNRFISPLDPESETSFLYQSDGRVVPFPANEKSQRERADYTIDLLKLNAPYLVNLRKRRIGEIDEAIAANLGQPKQLKALAEHELAPKGNKLNQFCTATRQRFGQITKETSDRRTDPAIRH